MICRIDESSASFLLSVTGAYVKIAFFAPAGTYGANTDADIIYHDDIHGPLITQTDKVEDMLFSKYFKGMLSYDKLQRIETYMLSRKIARELILNPVNHKDYARGVPIQLSVYDDHIEIFNVGSWPDNLPIDDTLYEKHESIPHNPKIADAFYRSGEIESWGRGFLKIRLECENINAPLPQITKSTNGVTVNAYGCENICGYIKVIFWERTLLSRMILWHSLQRRANGLLRVMVHQ